MPSDLRSSVRREEPYVIIELDGELDGPARPALRRTLLTCLAAQPAAVLVDLSRVRVTDLETLATFTEAHQEARDWPAAPLALCAAAGEAAARLKRITDHDGVGCFASVQAAAAAFARTGAHRLRLRLMPVVGAARRARELATDACGRWAVPGLIGPACTVVTEFVNNCVVHARTPMTVTMALIGRQLHIAVSDESPDAPRQKGPAAPTAPGGRGLMMVDAVARRWGYTTVDGGKVIWAVLG